MATSYKYNEESNDFSIIQENLGILPHIVWHITDSCRLSCGYCFATKTKDEFDINIMNEYVKIFKELGIQRIDISGGEPLLYPHLEILVNTLKANNICLTITTSSIGTKKNKNWLIANSHLFSWIIVSLDGYTKEYHDEIRGLNGTFQSAVSFIKSLNIENKRINTVVTKKNINLDIQQMYSFLKDLTIKSWCLIQPSIANMKENFDQLSISKLEFDSFLKSLKKEIPYPSDINITHRYPENYAGYWILYPNNKIIMHNEKDTTKDVSVDFRINNIYNIINEINNNKIWVPMSNDIIKIENVDKSILGSELLNAIASVLEEKFEIKETKETIPEAKCVIITSIIVGAASGVIGNLIYDAIKFGIKKLKNREDYNPECKIEINNTIIILKDIDNSEDITIQ